MATTSIPDLLIAAARRHGVDPRLAVEVAIAESNLNQAAVSSAGAIGVMQLMPATARGLGVDPRNLEQNIEGGVRLLRQLLSQFRERAQALAAYNWGPDRVTRAVRQWAGDWLDHAPAETRNYVQKILTRLGEWKREAPVTSAGIRELQSLSQPQQVGLMLLAVALGMIWLFDFHEVD